ncbi:MAG: OadG family protein [Clostridia bacterium]|nr:OadG family protein [Clostridia bacterium]MBR4086907.1 OadG family protein [Clostridia bacterium]
MLNAALMVPGEYNLGVVILLGMGIVFAGLICIVILCVLMGKVVRLLEKKEAPAAVSAPVAAAPATIAEAIPNRSELVAAISCCLAEELGTDVSAIRIVSLKKV